MALDTECLERSCDWTGNYRPDQVREIRDDPLCKLFGRKTGQGSQSARATAAILAPSDTTVSMKHRERSRADEGHSKRGVYHAGSTWVAEQRRD